MAKKTKPKAAPKTRISEVQRTVLLLVLLAFSIGFIIWIQSGIDENFVETL